MEGMEPSERDQHAHSNITRLVTWFVTRLVSCNGYKGHHLVITRVEAGTLVIPRAITRLVMKIDKLDFERMREK